jgi:hypothetical protein
VAVLHAMIIAFTPRPTNSSLSSSANVRTSASLLVP